MNYVIVANVPLFRFNFYPRNYYAEDVNSIAKLPIQFLRKYVMLPVFTITRYKLLSVPRHFNFYQSEKYPIYQTTYLPISSVVQRISINSPTTIQHPKFPNVRSFFHFPARVSHRTANRLEFIDNLWSIAAEILTVRGQGSVACVTCTERRWRLWQSESRWRGRATRERNTAYHQKARRKPAGKVYKYDGAGDMAAMGVADRAALSSRSRASALLLSLADDAYPRNSRHQSAIRSSGSSHFSPPLPSFDR